MKTMDNAPEMINKIYCPFEEEIKRLMSLTPKKCHAYITAWGVDGSLGKVIPDIFLGDLVLKHSKNDGIFMTIYSDNIEKIVFREDNEQDSIGCWGSQEYCPEAVAVVEMEDDKGIFIQFIED